MSAVLSDAFAHLCTCLGGGAEVSSSLTSELDDVLVVYPLELGPEPNLSPGGHPSPAFTIRLRCLVTTAAGGSDGLGLLDDALAAAADDERVLVDLAPLTADIWSALGSSPRPSFIAETVVRHQRAVEPTPLVTRPLQVVDAAAAPLSGRVIGPDEVPLPGATVEIVDTGATAVTNATGAFHFPFAPTGPEGVRLAVRAKGVVRVCELEHTDGPIVIEFELAEV